MCGREKAAIDSLLWNRQNYTRSTTEGTYKNFQVTDALRNCFDNVNYFRDFYDWFKTEEDIELREIRENPDYKNPKLNCVRTALERMIKGYSNLRIELAPSRMVMTNSEGVDL